MQKTIHLFKCVAKVFRKSNQHKANLNSWLVENIEEIQQIMLEERLLELMEPLTTTAKIKTDTAFKFSIYNM